jgi:16S rRNA (uracil1498-N3)-methyltransferase
MAIPGLSGEHVDRRFYFPPPLSAGQIALMDSESRHLATVLRGAVGDVVEVFDGEGRVAQATVAALEKRAAIVAVDAVHEEPPEPQSLTLATAVPKGERFDWLVEKATELGVTRLVPLITERSTVEPRLSKLDRLRQLVISACKQSGRNRLMEIARLMTWPAFLASLPSERRLIVATPEGVPIPEVLSRHRDASLWCIAIGPEGGWTPGELDGARHEGAEIASVGSHILRIETAALAAAAAWACHAATGSH